MSITNGVDNKYISRNDKVPSGWVYGRTKTEEERQNNILANKKTIGCFYVNNGVFNKRMSRGSSIPDGWVRGRLT